MKFIKAPLLRLVNIEITRITITNIQVIARENHFYKRRIKEAIEICTQQSTRPGYELPAIYDDLLSCDHSLMGGHVTRRDFETTGPQSQCAGGSKPTMAAAAGPYIMYHALC